MAQKHSIKTKIIVAGTPNKERLEKAVVEFIKATKKGTTVSA